MRLGQQSRGAGLGTAGRVAGADIGPGGVAVLEVLRDEAGVTGREGFEIVGHGAILRQQPRVADFRRYGLTLSSPGPSAAPEAQRRTLRWCDQKERLYMT